YEIINVNSNKALEVTGGSSSNGAVIQQNAYAGADYQKWSLNASGTYYVVKAKHSSKSITVEDASNSNGADIEQRSGSSNNQQWTISEVGCPVMTRGMEPIITKGEILPSELEVTVLPNPSATNFILNVKSNDKESAITVRVMDASGKMISVHPKVGLNTALRIGGEKWAGGIYFAEVTQGGQRKVVKMIKVN
ncbi:MAG: RICIN domain-containing protein, partial [Rhizobacter sp.]|nr:RICIN domain-containing protein [Ferruginibacter sp.]